MINSLHCLTHFSDIYNLADDATQKIQPCADKAKALI